MNEDKFVKCDFCGKEVPDWTLTRDGECASCRAADKAKDMGVGDIGSR